MVGFSPSARFSVEGLPKGDCNRLTVCNYCGEPESPECHCQWCTRPGGAPGTTSQKTYTVTLPTITADASRTCTNFIDYSQQPCCQNYANELSGLAIELSNPNGGCLWGGGICFYGIPDNPFYVSCYLAELWIDRDAVVPQNFKYRLILYYNPGPYYPYDLIGVWESAWIPADGDNLFDCSQSRTLTNTTVSQGGRGQDWQGNNWSEDDCAADCDPWGYCPCGFWLGCVGIDGDVQLSPTVACGKCAYCTTGQYDDIDVTLTVDDGLADCSGVTGPYRLRRLDKGGGTPVQQYGDVQCVYGPKNGLDPPGDDCACYVATTTGGLGGDTYISITLTRTVDEWELRIYEYDNSVWSEVARYVADADADCETLPADLDWAFELGALGNCDWSNVGVSVSGVT